jgi:hypothetical protein
MAKCGRLDVRVPYRRVAKAPLHRLGRLRFPSVFVLKTAL